MIFPFRINRLFYSYFLKCEREMLANVFSMVNKQNPLRPASYGTARQRTEKQPHKPKQSILMHISAYVCACVLLISSVNHLKCFFPVIFYAVWVTVSTLYLLLICTHNMQF